METFIPTATLHSDHEGVHLEVHWSGPTPLGRPCTGGWLFGTSEKQRKLANRLAKAINAGVVYTNIKVKKDIGGKTYVEADQTQFFHQRHLGKSLRAVGF